VTALLPLFELVVVVAVVVEAQPRGDEGSSESIPLSEKLPNCSERFGVAALSHLPILRYGRGLVEADPVERGTSISLGEPGTTIGLASATGDFGAGALSLPVGGERTGLPRAQAFGVDAFLGSVELAGVDEDHSSMVDVETSSVPHPAAIFEVVVSTVVSTVFVFFFSTVFFGDALGLATFSTAFIVSVVSTTATVSLAASAEPDFCVFLLLLSCCGFFFGLAGFGASGVAAVGAAVSVSAAGATAFSAGFAAAGAATAGAGTATGSTGLGVDVTLVTFSFFVHAPVSTG
jgi:hypothetical protein